MSIKRVGRFELHGRWNSPLQYSGVEIKCDHSNGTPNEYFFPNVSTEDARDLIHMLQEELLKTQRLEY